MSASTTDKALDAITHWASTADRVVFRHLRVNNGDFTHCGIRNVIWKSVKKNVACVIFVGSKAEIDVTQDEDWGSGSESPPRFMTYLEFVALLENNRAEDGKGPNSWKKKWQPDGWIKESILPSRALIVMSIEPQMPCECALALVAAAHWAMDIAQRRDGCARVLTMSPEEEAPAVGRLLKLYSAPRATQVDMSDALAARYQTTYIDTSELARQILLNLTPEPAEKDIILCFPPHPRIFALGAHFQRLNASGALEKGWIETQSSDLRTSRSMRIAFQSSESPGHLVYMENGFRAPCGIDGFDRVHIVLGSVDIKPVFDAVTGQITVTGLALSRDERLEQVAWAGRASCLPENIFVYLDEHRAVDEFVEAGHERRRLQVSNHQLGGFLGALAGMSHWGLDVFQIAKQFVREGFALDEMRNRLKRQGILTQPSASFYKGLTLGMRDDERIIFKAVLPILDYDHRVAYFLARRSSSSLLRHLKIQVAAVLCVGPTKVVTLQDVAGKTTAETLSTLANACWGCTRRMANTGTIWLMSGLWKRVAKENDTFRSEEKEKTLKILIPDTSSYVSSRCSLEVANIITALDDALSDLEVPNWQKDITKEVKELDLTEPQQLELQRDLLHAYVYQLLVSTSVIETGGMLTNDISTRKMFPNVPEWLGLTMDAVRQTEKNTRAVFGIYHFLRRTGDDVEFQNWTWIPTQLVSDWHLANAGTGSTGTIHNSLVGQYLPTKNFDDVEWHPSR